MARTTDHHRSIADPYNLADAFASGVEVQDFDEWIRLIWIVDTSESARGARRKVAAVVVPRSAAGAIIQQLRSSAGNYREARRH